MQTDWTAMTGVMWSFFWKIKRHLYFLGYSRCSSCSSSRLGVGLHIKTCSSYSTWERKSWKIHHPKVECGTPYSFCCWVWWSKFFEVGFGISIPRGAPTQCFNTRDVYPPNVSSSELVVFPQTFMVMRRYASLLFLCDHVLVFCIILNRWSMMMHGQKNMKEHPTTHKYAMITNRK